jgi:hypothetical protein
VYGRIPPVPVAVAVPSLPPKQLIFVPLTVTVVDPELVTVAMIVLVQPLLSVTVAV